LVALGSDVLPILQTELNQRIGLQKDAVMMAIFRLSHPQLDIRDSLVQWGLKHFGVTDPKQEPATLFKLSHVFDSSGLHTTLFPNHVFYVVEYPNAPAGKAKRGVAALAVDGKVQSISDDAALAKFVGGEGEPQRTQGGKADLATAAALLAMPRMVTLKEAPRSEPIVANGNTLSAVMMSEGVKVTLALTFDATGKVTKAVTTQEGTPPAETVAATVPAATAPVPVDVEQH
jgi:hypothetical protein